MELSNGGCAKIETALTKEELDVFEAERRAVSRAVRVFTWTEEKEESHGNHVSCCFKERVLRGLSDCNDAVQDQDGDWFDSVRWQIGLII